MPIYAYRCEACGHAKDLLQKFSDPLLTICPSCGADAFKKQLTAAGFQLKGSGWYVTDFKGDSKGAKPAAEDASGSAAKSDGANGEAGKAEPAKPDSGKADTGKGDSGAPPKGKAEPGRAETGKGDSAKSAPAPAPAAAPPSGSGGGAGPALGGQ